MNIKISQAQLDAASIALTIERKNKKQAKKEYNHTSDPNYTPRVISEEYEVVTNDGNKIKKERVRHLYNPELSYSELSVMGRLPSQQNISFARMNQKALGNNSSKFKKTRTGKRIQVRPMVRRVINERGKNLINAGMASAMFNNYGFVDKKYIKSILFPLDRERTFGNLHIHKKKTEE